MIDQILVDDLNYPKVAYIKKGEKVIIFSFSSEEIWTESLSDFSMRKNKKDLKEVRVASLQHKVLNRHKEVLLALSVEED
jgi:hypothetical protein